MLRKVRGRRRVARRRGIALCLTGLMLLLLTGCVEQTLGPDRNAYLGSQIATVETKLTVTQEKLDILQEQQVVAKGLLDTSKLAVLSANYIKESLKGTLNLPYDMPCMHECVFNDEIQQKNHITTLDMAKRLLDYGFHPPTIYFPLVVHGAFMVEPTESESKEDIDQFIDAVKAIANEACKTPEKLKKAPFRTKVTRLDEVTAARKPCLKG